MLSSQALILHLTLSPSPVSKQADLASSSINPVTAQISLLKSAMPHEACSFDSGFPLSFPRVLQLFQVKHKFFIWSSLSLSRPRATLFLEASFFLRSFSLSPHQVDVTNRTADVDLTNYIPNGEWELLEARIIRNVIYYSCCPEPFPDVTITITIRYVGREGCPSLLVENFLRT